MKGKVVSVNVSEKKGTVKKPVNEITLEKNLGVTGDAHYGTPIKEVSLLALESVKKVKIPGFSLKPGDFAENITFSNLNLKELLLGTMLKIGEVTLEISQIGKQCHTKCAIFKKIGNCIMPKEGIFAKVLKGGKIKRGMEIILIKKP